MPRTGDKYVNRSADTSKKMIKFYTFKTTLALIGKVNSKKLLSDELTVFQNLLGLYITCVRCKRIIILPDFV